MTTKNQHTIELNASTVSFTTDKIMHIHIKSGTELNLIDAVLTMEAIGKLGDGKKYPVLIDCEEFSSVASEARILFAKKEGNIYSSADAIAYHSMAHQLFANFYMIHDKPEIPTRIFPDNDSAVAWLKTFRA
ncbi:MAG: hypothetical protein ACHQRM_17450 [Bacteroidia bacterium]